MSFFSVSDTVATGSSALVAVPFPYLNNDKSQVYIFLNDVAQDPTTYTWPTGSSILLNSTPAAGVRIRVQRHTKADAPVAVFTAGYFDDKDLNLVNLQQLYLAQEALDAASGLDDTVTSVMSLVAAAAAATAAANAATTAANLAAAAANAAAAIPPGFNGVPFGVSASGTVTAANSDKKTILMTGGRLTVNAPSLASMASNWSTLVVNGDAGSDKNFVLPDGQTLLLLPGQSHFIQRYGSTFAIPTKHEKFKLQGSGISAFYVDPNAGGTSGTAGIGTSGAGAFKTPQQAYDFIIRWIDCDNTLPQVNVISDITGTPLFVGFAGAPSGSCQVRFYGNPTAGSQKRWVTNANSQVLVQTRDGGIATFVGFDFDSPNTGCTALYVSGQASVVDYQYCKFGGFSGGYQIRIESGGYCNCLDAPGTGIYTIYGSAICHISIAGHGKHELGGVTIQMPNGCSWSGGFINGVGPGYLNWGFNAFSGPGSGAGSAGRQGVADGAFQAYLGGSTLPGNSAVLETNSGKFH